MECMNHGPLRTGVVIIAAILKNLDKIEDKPKEEDNGQGLKKLQGSGSKIQDHLVN